jgi:ligand-binding sensor domain-containing protein/two-component sensor histidine kinase
MIVILFLLLSLELFANGIPSADDYIFRQITIKEGLSQSSVLAILQDKEGFMWFGTGNGLNKFDGYNFTVYMNDPYNPSSISDNEISAIYEDTEGYIWIGTIKGILNRFNRANESFEHYHLQYDKNFKSNLKESYTSYPISFIRNDDISITSISEDKNGNLWLGTWGNGMFRFNKETGFSEHFYNEPNNPQSLSYNRVTKILTDKYGVLWVGTYGGGLNKITKDKNNSSYNFVHFEENKSIYSLSCNEVISIFEDSKENLWIGTYKGGLNRLDKNQRNLQPSKMKFVRYLTDKNLNNVPYNSVLTIIEDEKENLWLGTLGNGLINLNPATNSFSIFEHDPLNANSLPDNDVVALAKDGSGIIWIGTSLGRGITQLQVNQRKFNYLHNIPSDINSLSDNVVWAITEDKEGCIWIGTYRGGLNRYDRDKKQFKIFKRNPNNPNSIPENHIRSLAVDNNDNIWIGFYSEGLGMYDRKNGKFITYKHSPGDKNSIGANQILDILIESDTVFWVAAYGGGLNRLTFEGHNLKKVDRYLNDPDDSSSISDDRAYTILRDTYETLWIGTFGGGLNKFNKKTSEFKRFRYNPNEPSSLSNNRVICVFKDSDGIMWIGTFGGGLNKYNDKTNSFKRYGERDGLTSYIVYGILEDNHKNLWMSTNNGIFKFNKKDETFIQYDLTDGLQSLEFSGGAYFKASDGEMFFGGINGLNSFHPDSLKLNSYVPNIIISSFKILNKPLKGERKNIVLTYDENFFSFEFAALDYSTPEDNLYAYMLESFDKDWRYTDAKHRVAMYTNISPGDYTFKVIGSNSDGVWNYDGTKMNITILPPLWQRWWFIAGAIVALLFIIYYLSTLKIRSLLAIEKLKTKLAADLHDSIGTGLTEISILSELTSRELKNISDTTPVNLRSISETARRLIDNMGDIVWAVNPKRDSLHDLIIRLKDSYNEVLTHMGIKMKTVDLDKLENIKLPMEYKQNLFLIFKEGINNSVKHSKCDKIKLQVNLRGKVLEMILQDNGIGMDDSQKKVGNGLKNMENRATAIGGKLKWKSTKRGTTVTFVGKIGGMNKFLLSLKSFSR